MPTDKGTPVATNGSWGSIWLQPGQYSAWLDCKGRNSVTNRMQRTISPRIDVVVSRGRTLPVVNIENWVYRVEYKQAEVTYSSKYADYCQYGITELPKAATWYFFVDRAPAQITITCFNRHGSSQATAYIKTRSGKGDLPFFDVGDKFPNFNLEATGFGPIR